MPVLCMNNELKKLFNKLYEDRTDSAKTLEKKSMRGLKDSVVEKYSDQAHFIYELIQNADDVGATFVKFILYRDRLVFIHNGKRHFNITDVDREDEDSELGKLGDLNAITSIANSNKTAASIGKFGVGFKAVFQYTNEPHIYDPYISFKITRFIVPVTIPDDFSGKEKDETAFVFPFNHPNRTAIEAYNDILYKLRHLVFPTLFLNNLQSISYRCAETNAVGTYSQTVIENFDFHGTHAAKIRLVNNRQEKNETLWLFTRITSEGYKYSCGFFIDDENNLKQTNYPAFCFFPTKKFTNLNFIINAPFLLTDSREGIRAGVEHNIRMIELLAELSAECFVTLRDIGIKSKKHIINDSILEYIPIDKTLYTPANERDDISLLPFYEQISDVFRTEKLWPSYDEYVRANDGYIAFAALYCDYFSNEQLADLCKDQNARWIIPSISLETYYRAKASAGADARYSYIVNEIGISNLRDTNLIDKITASFMDNQTWEWIFKFYEFVLSTKDRIERCKNKPILFDQNDNAVAAYDDNGNAILFVDDSSSEGYAVVSNRLQSNPKALELIKRFDIHAPELKDKVFSKVLKKKELNTTSDFRSLLDFYIQLVEEDGSADYEFDNQILPEIKDKEFLLCLDAEGEEQIASPSDIIYYPTEELVYYFEGYSDVLFINLDKYNQFLTNKEKKYLEDFLVQLTVSQHVLILSSVLSEKAVKAKYPDVKWDYSSRDREWTDYELDACEFAIKKIQDNGDKRLSIILWNELVNAYEDNKFIRMEYRWFYRSSYKRIYQGTQTNLLKTSKWLFDRLGALRAPIDITRLTIDGEYNLSGNDAGQLMKFLGIASSKIDYSNLDEDVLNKMTEYDSYARTGVYDRSPEEVERALQLLDQEKEKNKSTTDKTEKSEKISSQTMRVIEDLKSRVKKHEDSETVVDSAKDSTDYSVNEKDSEELLTASVDFTKKKEQMKKRFESDIAQLAQIEEAQNIAANSRRYTYAWFRALQLLETLANGSDNANSREVNINFGKAERDLTSNRTVILRHPDKNIPMIMEQLVDIPMNLTFKDGHTKKLYIDAANVQSYALRVKVKQDDSLDNIEFDDILSIGIQAQSPAFLTQALLQEFAKFAEPPYNFADDYDMQSNLCENISFVFGPPGTGKTTYLARDTLIPLVKTNHKVRILVLAPTNKAADVLVSKVMDSMGEDYSYEKWLVRYGITADQSIEESQVFKGKEFEIDDYDKCVVVTTMARLPYDYFIDSTGKRNFLHGINWDYIVVDEASMIPLIYMVYLLYLKTPKRFIIAGDPFQIEPTTSVSEWKSENIYKMVHLEEFSESASTIPYKYDIKLLTTQYRSIPCIGDVFSKFTYKGVLKHNRTVDDARPLNIERYLEYDYLNIIQFPVSQYESIYKAKKLKSSNYQIYSALFAYEFTVYLSKVIAHENPNERFSIGIIAPYSAEAGLVDKLLAYADIPGTVSVNSSTIHGFQGDECDIIIALFNPPPHISTNKEIFLNKQNVINVAISRARDYLFVLVPDENTANVGDLLLLEKLKNIVRKNEAVELYANEVEELIFDKENYIEENAFTTGHQMVNVYGLPERRYEVRSEETALDVQVHGETKYRLLDTKSKPTPSAPAVVFGPMPECLVNHSVEDTKYGLGTIEEVDTKTFDIIVKFDDYPETKTFKFPDVFIKKRLTMKNRDIQKGLDEHLKNYR